MTTSYCSVFKLAIIDNLDINKNKWTIVENMGKMRKRSKDIQIEYSL